MSYLPLIHNIALLVSLSVIYALLTNRLRRNEWPYQLLSGIAFGGVAVIGMMTPLPWGPGIIFDGRSIILGVAGLFGGSLVVAVAAILCALYRLWLGGPGVAMGLAVISEAAILGACGYYLRRRRLHLITPGWLLSLGLMIHILMVVMLELLPGGLSWDLLIRVGTPVILIYPLAFMLVGLVFVQVESKESGAEALRASEEKFSKIFQMSPDAIDLTLLKSGVSVEFNPSFEKLYGYARNEIIGHSTLPPDLGLWLRKEDRGKHIADLEAHGAALGFEAPMRRKDGTIFTGLVSSSLLDVHGNLCNLTLVRDISEQKRAEEALRASEETFRSIFEKAPVGIFQSTIEGRLLYANPEYIRMMGFASFEELTQSIEAAGSIANLLWEDPLQRLRWVDDVASGQGWKRVENRYRKKDGTGFTANLIFTLMADVKSSASLLIGFIEDITERKQAEEALRASDERFSRIFYLSPDAITINRLEDGRYIDVNQSFTNMLGFTREEVIGRSSLPGDLDIWIDKADRDRVVTSMKTDGEVIGLIARFRNKNGSVVMALESSKILEINGEPCILSITRDITERMRAEELFRENAQRMQLAVAAGNFGIWDQDLQDGSLIWNDRMYDICGFDRHTFHPTHQYWSDHILHPEDRRPYQEAMHLSAEDGRPSYTEFRILRADGIIRHIGFNTIVIRDDEGRAIRMIGVNRDRTDQVEAEAERKRLRVDLQHAEKLESIGSLAGGVAHDMNNVLAAILITSEMLRQRWPDGDPVAKSLDSILHAGHRGRDLVKALTDFARKDLEEIRPIDLNDIVRKEVDLLRRTTFQKVLVTIDLSEHLPLVLGDASAIGSAVMNLGINAVDAMPDGGTLSLATRRLQGDLVELSIRDTGSGMSAEVRAKAIEPFFTTKPVGKGTGLGLARVYGIVKAHGGSMDIQSELGAGTVVTLSLPAISNTQGEVARVAYPPVEAPHRLLNILLVDDDRIILETIPIMLESLGHHVDVASIGEEAIQLLENGLCVDLIILDQNMPGLKGVEVLLVIRKNHPTLPVIVSSGFLDPCSEERLSKVKHIQMLKKPYSMREIQKALTKSFSTKTNHD